MADGRVRQRDPCYVVGSITLEPVAANVALDCPNGQRATLTSALWSNATLSDLTNNVSTSVPIE